MSDRENCGRFRNIDFKKSLIFRGEYLLKTKKRLNSEPLLTLLKEYSRECFAALMLMSVVSL